MSGCYPARLPPANQGNDLDLVTVVQRAGGVLRTGNELLVLFDCQKFGILV